VAWYHQIGKAPHLKKYSQYGEEGYLKYIFKHIGTTNKFLVDIGANDGKWLSNSRLFLDEGWTGLLVDGAHENELVKKHFVTRENILQILYDNAVPVQFDLLSIDIDGNDYWVLDALLHDFSPRVIISEFNSEFEPSESKAIKYDPDFKFKANDYYGYTFAAGLKLAERHGYTIIHQSSNLNLYYVREDLLPEGAYVHVDVKKFKWWGPAKEPGKWVTI